LRSLPLSIRISSMSVVSRYYLGVAANWAVLVMWFLTKLPIFLFLFFPVWLFYALQACPDCNALFKKNRLNWWRFPSTTCLKCGRDLTKP